MIDVPSGYSFKRWETVYAPFGEAMVQDWILLKTGETKLMLSQAITSEDMETTVSQSG